MGFARKQVGLTLQNTGFLSCGHFTPARCARTVFGPGLAICRVARTVAIGGLRPDVNFGVTGRRWWTAVDFQKSRPAHVAVCTIAG